MKTQFSVIKKENGWGISYDNGITLKTDSGNMDLIFHDKGAIEFITQKLNNQHRPNMRNGRLVDQTCSAYNILSHHVDNNLEKENERYWKYVVSTLIQWDKCYRRNPDPHMEQIQIRAYAPLFTFFAAKNISVPNLKANDAQGIEEFEKRGIDKLDDAIVDLIYKEFMSLSKLKRSAVFVLTRIFNEISLSTMFLTGRMDLQAYKNALCAPIGGYNKNFERVFEFHVNEVLEMFR